MMTAASPTASSTIAAADNRRGHGLIRPAMAGDAKYQDALVNRGVAHERQGRLDQAIRDYDEAVKLDPKDPVALKKASPSAPSQTTISRFASTTSSPAPISAAPSRWRAGGSTLLPSPTTIT